MQTRFCYSAMLALGLLAAGRHSAFADAATEAQLRAALQASTTQIAQLEDQVANLQASQAPNVATIEALRSQLQSVQAGKTATNSGAASSADLAKDAAEIAALKQRVAVQAYQLSQSRTAYQTASSAAGSASQQNAALSSENAGLNTTLGGCREKNAQLFAIGNQILDAYSHKDDLFDSIADREPFTGIKRVQLQNIVQDDEDKLYNNQVSVPAGSPQAPP